MEAFEPLNNYYLAPDYGTREAAEAATGEPCRPWNPERKPKYWRILEPGKIEGVQQFELDGVPMVIFPRAFFGKVAADGTGVIESLAMSLDEAQNFNIPPTTTGSTNVPGADKQARPVPLKKLGDRQVIAKPTAFLWWQVRNLDVPLDAKMDGFRQADRDKLNAIAATLGV